MVGLPDGEKKFEDMCNRLGTIPACDRRTDRRTDEETSCHGIVCAMHTRHAVKNHDIRSISRFISPMMQDIAIVIMEGE